MSKQALCILASTFHKLVAVSTVIEKTETLVKIRMDEKQSLFDFPTTLESRSTCETDTTLLQILPYVTLNHVDAEGKLHVYTYQRGNGSGESRLKGDYSVGFGGHIEEAPGNGRNLEDVITDCVIRELEEEIGVTVSRFKVQMALQHAVIFHDTSNNVGKVHLALSISLVINPSDFGKLEEGVIEKVKMELYNDVFMDMIKPEQSERKFESWSRIAMGF